MELKKQELLATCINILKEPPVKALDESKPAPCHFSLYVSEKLAQSDKRTRAIAEKRITDVIFDLEFNSTTAFTNIISSNNNLGHNFGSANAMNTQFNELQSNLMQSTNLLQNGNGPYMSLLQQ